MPVDYDIYDPANADRLYNDFYGGSPGFVARGGGAGSGVPGRDAIAAAMMAQQTQQQQQQQQQLAALPPQGGGGDGGGGFGLYDLFYAGSPGFTPGRGPGYGNNPWAPGYPRRPGDGGDGDGNVDGPGTIGDGVVGGVDDYYQGHPGPAEPQSFPGNVAPTPDVPGPMQGPMQGPQQPIEQQFIGPPQSNFSDRYEFVPNFEDRFGPYPTEQQLIEYGNQSPYAPQSSVIDNPLTASASTVGYGPSTDYASALAAELGYGSVAEMFDAVNSGAFGGDELVGGGGGSYSEVEDPYGDADYDAGGFDDYGGDDEE